MDRNWTHQKQVWKGLCQSPFEASKHEGFSISIRTKPKMLQKRAFLETFRGISYGCENNRRTLLENFTNITLSKLGLHIIFELGSLGTRDIGKMSNALMLATSAWYHRQAWKRWSFLVSNIVSQFRGKWRENVLIEKRKMLFNFRIGWV